MHKFDFSNIHALVFGDVMLDSYFSGSVERISPEAPVPIVKVKSEKYTLGGAGNVANNIAQLGGKAYLAGFIGKDTNAAKLLDLLKQQNIKNCLTQIDVPTITKVRTIGDHQHIVRLDFESTIPAEPDKKVFETTVKTIDKILGTINVIIISDYNKNTCHEKFCAYLIKAANKKKIPVIIDPKGKLWQKYSGAFIITPNLKELIEIADTPVPNDNKAVTIASRIVLKKYGFERLLVTRSEKGMSLVSKEEDFHISSDAKEVYDVSGAGDTVVATLALGIANGLTINDAVRLANTAAGIVVSKLGTTPITYEEIAQAYDDPNERKVVTVKRLQNIIKNSHKKIVFTNGCFDIIHRGHIDYLQKAKMLGDLLVIGLNTDASVKKLKGEGRPLNKEMDRAAVLSALEFVDYVILFNEDTPRELIKSIKPDYLVKGADYKKDEIAGHEFAKEVVLIDYLAGYSTTNIINKMHQEKVT